MPLFIKVIAIAANIQRAPKLFPPTAVLGELIRLIPQRIPQAKTSETMLYMAEFMIFNPLF
jgi:hypothetical protein